MYLLLFNLWLVVKMKFKSIFLVITMMLSQPMLAGCFERSSPGDDHTSSIIPNFAVCIQIETNVSDWSIVLPAPLYEYENGTLSYHPFLNKLVNESDVEPMIIDGRTVEFSYRKYNPKFTIELSNNLTMTIRGVDSVSHDMGPSYEACSHIRGTFTLPKFIWQTVCIEEHCNQIPLKVILDDDSPSAYLNGVLSVSGGFVNTEYAKCAGSGIWLEPLNLTQEYVNSTQLNCTFVKS